MSRVIRIVCGLLGFGGVAAAAFNAISKGGVQADFTTTSTLIGSFIFLYAAFFGTIPWGGPDEVEQGPNEMTKSKWQVFWIAFVAFLVVATAFLAEKGVFLEADIVVLALVLLLFALVGIALYFYIRSRPEDIGIKW